MTERYGALTLQLKQLSNLADIGSAHTNVLDASGVQKLSESGSGRFTIPRDFSAISAIDSNIGQVAYVYLTDQVASGAAMDVATFIIKDVDRSTDPNGLTIAISGDSLEDQLTYADLDDDTIDDGAGGADTSDIDSIMAYAPSGWTYNINGGAGTGSSNGSYFTSRGNNVLQLLIAATKQNSGDTFRLSSYSPPAKTIRWNTTADSSGVTLRMPATPTDYDGSTTVGIILSMAEDSSFEDVVTRIRPYGAGLDDGRLDITDIDAGDTGGDPAWATTTFASNLIVNTTLETSLGYSVKRDIDFSRNRAADITDATQLASAAVALWNEGITYLEERDSTKKFYRLSCVVAADLRPGQTVTIVYTEYEGGISGGSAVWSVNDSFYIHQVTNRVSSGGNLAGVRVTDLIVSDTLAPKATGGRMIANALQTIRETTRKSNALSTPGAVPTSTTLNATLPLRIDGGDSGDLSANRTFTLDGLTSYGAANQVAGVTAAATGWEYKTLTEGTGITIGHSAGAITITNSSPGGTDISGLAYVTIGNTGSLSAERALTEGDGIDIADGGANSTVTLSVDVTDFIGNGLVEVATNNIALGAPGSTTSTSTNAVTASSHTHEADSSLARAQISINAGDGLTGGGNLTANRTITMGTPSTLTVSTTNAVTTTSHTHAITSSSAVSTATAVILATDGNGRVQVRGLGIGASAGTNNAVTLPDDGWIGLGSSAARIVFDNQATDQIEILDSHLLINGQTLDSNLVGSPAERLTVFDGRVAISSSSDSATYLAYGYGTGIQGGVSLRSARGTRGTPTATQSNDNIGRVGAGGHTGSAFAANAGTFVQFVATETWSGSAQGARAELHVTPNGSTTSQRAFWADESGIRVVGRIELVDTGNAMGIDITTGGNANTSATIDFPDVTNSTASLRLFRTTNTSGARDFVIFRGDGSSTRDHTFTANGGYVSGGATGGDKGLGTINVSGDIYKNNGAYTNPDYALEAWRDGRIVQHAHKPGARDYRRLTLGEVEDHIRANLRLPGISDRPMGMFERGDFALEKIEELFTHLIELNHKVEALHGANN